MINKEIRKIILAIGSSEIGGAQKAFFLMIRELQKKGLEIVVFLPKGPLVHSLKESNCQLIIIDFSSFTFWKTLYKVLKQKDIDIINSYLSGCSFFFSIINIFFRHPICASLHNQIIHAKLTFVKKKVYPLMYKILSKIVDIIIVNSEYNKKHFESVGRINSKRIRVIPNGIDENFGKNNKVTSISKGRTGSKRIAYIGRLSKEKGVSCLLSALTFLGDYDIDCIIVGDGPMRRELEAYVTKKDLTKRVHFLGFISEIEPWLMSSDIVVVPSINEAFGITIIEAFAFKKLVIATNTGAIPELIEDGRTGFLFEVNNHLQLANKIQYAIHNCMEAEWIGENAYRFFDGAYTSRATCEKTMALYETILKQN